MSAEPAGVRADKVSFSYGETPMLFDFAIPAGSIAALMGPSGSGKSTLLHLIAGFETPTAGHILVGGQDVTGLPAAERPVSMVFQENNLFAHLTAEAKVGLGVSPALRAEMIELVAELQAERQLTVLLVTHHPEDVQRIASRIVFLQDGRVAAEGETAKFFGKDGPEVFLRYIGNTAPRA